MLDNDIEFIQRDQLKQKAQIALEYAYHKDSEGIMNLEEADSLSEQIAKYISEQIISGELVEGERIQELRIAKELDVSRALSVKAFYCWSVLI